MCVCLKKRVPRIGVCLLPAVVLCSRALGMRSVIGMLGQIHGLLYSTIAMPASMGIKSAARPNNPRKQAPAITTPFSQE